MATGAVTPNIVIPANIEIDDEKINNLLRRYNSATSSTTSLRTTTTLPSYNDSNDKSVSSPAYYPVEAKELLLSAASDTSSIHSAEPAYTTQPAFKADKIFQINAQGKSPFSFPSPPKELEISIDEHPNSFSVLNEKSSIGVARYKSIRIKRSSGSCTLWHNSPTGNQVPLAETKYQFGPGKPPVINLLSSTGSTIDTFELKGVSIFNRTVAFESGLFGKLRWEYYSSRERKEFTPSFGTKMESVPCSIIALKKVVGEGKKKAVVELARFIRSDEFRTEGTYSCDAGNGGRLEISFERFGINLEDEEAKRNIESLVLAGTLLMMKKEIDRLRSRQIGVMAIVLGPH